MSCHGCATNFSLFVKENTCPNCKFSFCAKCLKGNVNTDEASQNICGDCSKKLSGEAAPSAQSLEPPQLLLKRLETLENPTKPPITIFRHKHRLLNFKATLDPEDKLIMERLEKLREDRNNSSPPTESELKKRLLILKGLNVECLNNKQIIHPPDKTEQEEVDELLERYMSEMTLKGKINEEIKQNLEEMKKRVQKLQAVNSITMQEPFCTAFDSDDGDSISKNMMERLIAEAELEKKLEMSSMMSDDNFDDDDDIEEENINVNYGETMLKWCIICNDDATIKCNGCDGSLYCHACFKQGHEFFNMEHHESVQFK